MKNVKVIIWGLGAMGGGMADLLLKKKGVDIVGVAGRGAKIGKMCIRDRYQGMCVAICEGLKHIQKNMKESEATVMLGVPLIFETMHKRCV